jgi:PIN domain nuclease of toxin-antitoxin system
MDDQKRALISDEVKRVLSLVSGVPVNLIENQSKLTGNLHLNNLQIRALAVPFTDVVRKFKQGSFVTPNECEQCETVGDCIDLIFSKS